MSRWIGGELIYGFMMCFWRWGVSGLIVMFVM
jgi:hypothetical protein